MKTEYLMFWQLIFVILHDFAEIIFIYNIQTLINLILSGERLFFEKCSGKHIPAREEFKNILANKDCSIEITHMLKMFGKILQLYVKSYTLI